ncbi:17499_t:CDS:2 [Funneliformis geosporum]|uniref:14034_t:CDS:1 n=1 Tax=Funneliformis geosporum TaxID=1117311 RepID=A0A9W4WHB5_9GLOM|nr:14034_t:CDS:2 [Funneliformis geosporum]CAI2163716.1 17499_t:CDS:2 [Funneliformis geosporum]
MPVDKSGEDISPTVNLNDLKVGQKVLYHPVGGSQQTTEGIIKEIMTEPEVAGNRQVQIKASETDPRILIENSNTHKETGKEIV